MIIAVVGADRPLGQHLATALERGGHEVTGMTSCYDLDIDKAWNGRPDPDVLVVTDFARGNDALTQAADLRDWASDYCARTVICTSAESYPYDLQTPPLECYEVVPGRPPRTIAGARALHEVDMLGSIKPALNPSGSRDRIIETIFNDPNSGADALTTARLFGVYGYTHGVDDYWVGHAVHNVVADVLRRHPRLLVVDGQTADFIHVDDAVGALVALIEQRVIGPVNIGTGAACSMVQLVKLAIEALGDPTYDPAIELLDDADVPTIWQVADATRMARIHQPHITLTDGLRRQIAYQRDRAAA